MSSFFIDVLSGLAVALYGLKGGYTKVNVKGQSIRIAVDNFRTLQRAKTYSIKEPDTLDWLDSFEPGSCFFDLGANIGQYLVKEKNIKIPAFSSVCKVTIIDNTIPAVIAQKTFTNSLMLDTTTVNVDKDGQLKDYDKEYVAYFPTGEIADFLQKLPKK